MNVFNYDSDHLVLELNEPEILLIREFKALLDRDKTKTKTRVNKELTYIYLALDWKSPYSNYLEQERHEEALADSGLTEAQFNDPIFREACRKYRKLQESARRAADQFIDYFETIVDLNERDINGKPIFSAEKVMKEMAQLSNVHEQLITLEKEVKESVSQESTTRGGVNTGYDPGDF